MLLHPTEMQASVLFLLQFKQQKQTQSLIVKTIHQEYSKGHGLFSSDQKVSSYESILRLR